MNSPTKHPPRKLRKEYSDTAYPMVVPKFDDAIA